ncbi:unnamed protein product [Allacma fusca]|uniref:Uncharacterized protein n=1 Tax=Allacma fusca TaxID=39272 RepID=A0A8J2JPS3_9HEXA|nr:unnamed protein product [Allacma fusca]
MNVKQIRSRSPLKKSAGVKEQVGRRKEVELQNKAITAVANLEHEFGKYLYEFFFSCFNLILYHRGLHSRRLFAYKESKLLEVKIPHIRFPETLVYLEKVTEKGINCLMADYLEAFLFEERDRYGNSVTFMFRLHGFPAITPTSILFKEEIIAELKSNCESLLYDLTRTLKNMPPITQANMFRWKIELGLKKIDMRNSKWKNNNQGIFVNDPDWKLFPWSRNARSNKRDSSQESSSPSTSVEMTTASLTCPENTKRNDEEGSNYFGGSNFEDVTLEEDMGTAPASVQEEYEKEGLSIIEYADDSEENRPGSPDMFADSQNVLTPTSSKTFHLDSNLEYQPGNTGGQGSETVFTLASTEPQSPSVSSPSSGSEVPEHDSSAEEFKDATNIFDDFDDFSYLDKVLEILEDEDISTDELDVSLNTVNKGTAKFYPIATSVLLDKLLCNILVFKDTQANEINSDYKPPPPKRRSKRS